MRRVAGKIQGRSDAWILWSGDNIRVLFFLKSFSSLNTIERRCRDQSELPLEWGHCKDSLPCGGT